MKSSGVGRMVREIDRMDVLRGRGGKGVWGVAEWLWETRYEERVANRLCGRVRVFVERAQRGTCTKTKKVMGRQREKEGGRALDIRLGGRDGIHWVPRVTAKHHGGGAVNGIEHSESKVINRGKGVGLGGGGG
jgi:hypothetical protein